MRPLFRFLLLLQLLICGLSRSGCSCTGLEELSIRFKAAFPRREINRHIAIGEFDAAFVHIFISVNPAVCQQRIRTYPEQITAIRRYSNRLQFQLYVRRNPNRGIQGSVTSEIGFMDWLWSGFGGRRAVIKLPVYRQGTRILFQWTGQRRSYC